MRIKWIELNGFKSFPERTKIELNEGITCFVGPNGAGKSNIVDAFRWALGEHNPRMLRGEKMEEVIFQGSSTKKEKGLADVAMLIEIEKEAENGNEPQKREIEIKRRFFRTGESYFIINGKQARLKDIREIFISEGVDIRTYSIIDSARIIEILSKPSYRRALLDECAGISFYKIKKSESESKLQSAKENLQRIEDILGELKKQYSLLERQAKKAEKYKKILEELTALELSVSRTESLMLIEELESVRKELDSIEQKKDNLKKNSDEVVSKINELKDIISELENSIHEKENKLKQTELQRANSEKELALLIQEDKNKREQIEKLKEQNIEIQREIEKLQNDLNETKSETLELEQDIEKITNEILEFEEKLLKSQEKSEDFEKQLEKQRKILFNLTTELANKKNHYQSVKKSIENSQNRLNSIEYKKKEIADKIKQFEKEIGNKELKIKSLKDSLQNETDAVNKLSNELSKAEKAIEEKNQRLFERKKEEAVIKGKIEALSSEIWEDKQEGKLFFECIDVAPEVEELLESLLDEKLKASVIESFEQIIPSQNKKFFFLKDFVNCQKTTSCDRENLKIKNYIKIKDQSIPEQLFENILIADTLEEALAIKQKNPNFCVITRQGEIIFPDGFIKTGKAGNLLKKKRALDELKVKQNSIYSEIKTIENELETLKKEREQLKDTIQTKRAQISKIKNELFQHETHYKNHQKEYEQLKQRVKYIENEKQTLQMEIHDNTQLIKNIQAEIEQISMNIDEAETKIEELKSLQKEMFRKYDEEKELLSKRKSDLSALKERLNSKRTDVSRITENTKRLLVKKMKNEEEIGYIIKKIDDINIAKSEKNEKIKQLTIEAEKLKEELSFLMEKIQKEKTSAEELDKKYQSINKEIQNFTALIGEKKANEGELKARLQNLWNNIYNFYGKDILREEIEPVENPDSLKPKIAQLKNQLKDIGPVDIEILKEHQEVKERYEFMLSQQKDIKTSIEELEDAIRKINSFTRRKLRETFELLKEKFNSVFQELFGGGKAELILTNEENILDAELEIKVQPPGKKSNNINLLSQGEKTLTAIAFVFSCFSIRPSPICILDEVDAPLDDANTIRLRNLVKNLSNKTQFLIITHNKLMMEIANYLYGVTMQEEGISSVISLELQEAEAYAQ